jgi:hypothetical protein
MDTQRPMPVDRPEGDRSDECGKQEQARASGGCATCDWPAGRREAEHEVEEADEESFPASDPPESYQVD